MTICFVPKVQSTYLQGAIQELPKESCGNMTIIYVHTIYHLPDFKEP